MKSHSLIPQFKWMSQQWSIYHDSCASLLQVDFSGREDIQFQ